jgi:hypothetical protein
MRTSPARPAGSRVNSTPAVTGSIIAIASTAISTVPPEQSPGPPSSPRNARYVRGAGCQSEAQVSRTARSTSAGSTPRTLRYWPANDADPRSSAVADERSASRDAAPCVTKPASCAMASVTTAGRGAVRNASSIVCLAAAWSAGSGIGVAHSRSIRSRSGPSATAAR